MVTAQTAKLMLVAIASLSASSAGGQDFDPCAVPRTGGYESYSSSGDETIDHAVIAEARSVVRIMGINPGLRFIAGDGMFANAEPLVNGTSGTIYMGVSFVSDEAFRQEGGGVAVAGALAHEGAHIFQFENGYIDMLCRDTTKLIELHADFLSGYYMSRTGRTESDVTSYLDLLERRGDKEFNNPRHHGTSEERRNAMLAGFQDQSNDIAAAADAGMTYLEAP